MIKTIGIVFVLTITISLVFASDFSAQTKEKIGYLIDKKYESLTKEEKAGFAWLKDSGYNTELINVDEIESDVDLIKYDILWWHYDEYKNLPQKFYSDKVKTAIINFMRGDKGILFSLFAAQYLSNLKIEIYPPNVVAVEKYDTTQVVGFYPVVDHYIFKGNKFWCKVLRSVEGKEYSSVYYLNEEPAHGEVLAAAKAGTKNKIDKSLVVETRLWNTKIISIGAYTYLSDIKNPYRKNLEKFLKRVFNYLGTD
jgi:hypothetical protein